MSADQARAHVFRSTPTFAAERQILTEVVTPGCLVLDVGTAATGRSASLCRDAGARVVSIDINKESVEEFAATGDLRHIELALADMARLPFAACVFDLVLIAFHGFDYLTEVETRRRALVEAGRVLAPRGYLVLNSWNRLATTISPAGLRSGGALWQRVRHLLRGGPFRSTLVDGNGLVLHQELPHRLIGEVEVAAGVTLQYMTNTSGTTRQRTLVTIGSPAPYYVFRRGGDGA